MGGGREQLQAGPQGKCLSPGGRKFACKAGAHAHVHTSEYSLTGVRKQSKLLHSYPNSTRSQEAGKAQEAITSTCVWYISPSPGLPTPTPCPWNDKHSHKQTTTNHHHHHHSGAGTLPSKPTPGVGRTQESQSAKKPQNTTAWLMLGKEIVLSCWSS